VSWRDRTIGIVLGVLLGVGVVIAFVFLLSEQTVDAPSVSTGQRASGAQVGRGHGHGHPGGSPQQQPAALATVRIVGGAPPPSGPAELHYHQGDHVRLSVVSDATVGLELTGYGLTRTVTADQPTEIDFTASRTGTFGLILADSHIDVARISVGGG
jgi:hypothetical protein